MVPRGPQTAETSLCVEVVQIVWTAEVLPEDPFENLRFWRFHTICRYEIDIRLDITDGLFCRYEGETALMKSAEAGTVAR